MSIEFVMPSNHLILCPPLLFPPSTFPSIKDFSNESVLCIRWPKNWSFSFCICSFNVQDWFPFRIDWFDLAVYRTKYLQYHSSKASILPCSAHPYMTTGKTIALTRWTFVGKVVSLLFNMLSRLVIVFLPRNKRLLISWLQSPSAVILEPPPHHLPPNKVCHCFWNLPGIIFPFKSTCFFFLRYQILALCVLKVKSLSCVRLFATPWTVTY